MRKPWFEAVATIVLIVALLGSLLLYTGTWPPMVVVVSDSMQHSNICGGSCAGPDQVGEINAGDLVLVKAISSASDVTTYVQGLNSGYTTYGEPGDVLVYYPDGDTGTTPVIHRAIVWLEFNASQDAFNAPSLFGLSCGVGQQYVLENTGSSATTCVNSPDTPIDGQLILYNVGWDNVNVDIQAHDLIQVSPWSGFVTLGDANQGLYDQGDDCHQLPLPVPSCLVKPAWIEGVARGMIPWVGAIKLWLSGDTVWVPAQTWDYLGVTIAAILILPQAIPWVYRRWRERRSEAAKNVGHIDNEPPDTS